MERPRTLGYDDAVKPLLRAVAFSVTFATLAATYAFFLPTSASAAPPSADEIVRKMLETDTWGLAGAEVTARAIVKDARGSTRTLVYTAKSRRHAPPLSKSLLRFSAPADLAGVSFLQIQKADGDDDRHLYLPELRRSRRVAGNTRGSSFMGTDFNYADLDRGDFRRSRATHQGEAKIGKHACWKLEVVPTGKDAQYARFEVWVRKDNFVALKVLMYNRAGVLIKTLETQELRRMDGRWFVTRALLTNHADSRTTQLVVDRIVPRDDIPDDEFTVRNLEKQ